MGACARCGATAGSAYVCGRCLLRDSLERQTAQQAEQFRQQQVDRYIREHGAVPSPPRAAPRVSSPMLWINVTGAIFWGALIGLVLQVQAGVMLEETSFTVNLAIWFLSWAPYGLSPTILDPGNTLNLGDGRMMLRMFVALAAGLVVAIGLYAVSTKDDGSPAPELMTSAAPGSGSVALATSCTVRAEPSKTAAALGTARSHQRYVLLATRGHWHKIVVAQQPRLEGWVGCALAPSP